MVKNLQNKRGVYLEYTPDTEEAWIYARWMGQLTVSEVKDGSSAILISLKTHKFSRIINDNRDLVGHWSDANDWIEQEWLPKAIDAGLKKFAHILSHYSFGQLSAREMQMRMGNKFEMQLFNNIDEAKEWLRLDK